MRSKCCGDVWCGDSSVLAGWGFRILRHIHAWLIACKLQHASTMRWKQWSQGQTQKKELTLTIHNSPRFHENARICECHQTRHSLYQLKSFLQTLQTQPVSPPTLSCTFRNFHATFDRVIKVWLSQTPRILPTVSQALRRCICCKYHTLKQIGIFFCLECSKWTFAWNLQNWAYSWKFDKNDIRSNLAI